MNHLKYLLSKGSLYGKGRPDNIITDDAQAERDALRRTGPTQQCTCAFFTFSKAHGDGYIKKYGVR